MSRLAKAIHLPAVTSYLLAGLLLGPFFLGRLGLSNFGIGFGTLEQVDSLSLITQVALGFIAFVIGNEFRLSALESMGRPRGCGAGHPALHPARHHLHGLGHHAGCYRSSHGPCRHPDGRQAVQGRRPPHPPAADGGRHRRRRGPRALLRLLRHCQRPRAGPHRRHQYSGGAGGGDRLLAGSGRCGGLRAQPAGNLFSLPLQAHEPFRGLRAADGRR